MLPMVEGGKGLHEMKVYDEGLLQLQFPFTHTSAGNLPVFRKGEGQKDQIEEQNEGIRKGRSMTFYDFVYLECLSVAICFQIRYLNTCT